MAAWLAIGTAAADVKLAFITSEIGNGNLSTWDSAGGATGLAAADAICQTAAANFDLPQPATFRAWISSSTNDAYCRLRSLSGTRANHCGLPQIVPLPPAGPWLRTDGFPFAASLDDLLAPTGVVYTAPATDEQGTPASGGSIWTGTTDLGESGDNCSNWTGGSDGLFGSMIRTTGDWTEDFSSICAVGRRLLCMQAGAGDPLVPVAAPGRVAFLSSLAVPGNIGGVAVADTLCRLLADDVGLAFADTFKAWLSTEDSDAVARFAHDGPWVRTDGIPLAADLAALTGPLFAPLNVTETGEYLEGSAWTGTDEFGLRAAEHCDSWADSAAEAVVGRVNDRTELWTDLSSEECSENLPFYCLSDAPGNLLFADGLEAGSLRWWPSSPP